MKELGPGTGPILESGSVREDTLKPRVKPLVERARRRGHATYAELLPLPPGRLEQTLVLLQEHNLAVKGAFRTDPRPTGTARPSHRQPLSLYLNDIAKAPLLTPEDEFRLAREVEIAFKRARLRVLSTERGLAAASDALGDPPGPQPSTPEGRRRLLLRMEALDLAPEFVYPVARQMNDPAVNTLLVEYEAALRRMVQANLRLVVSIAAKYKDRGAPLLDMIQDGNAGLMRAAALFRPCRGWRFSTYAVWWIRQSILQGIGDYAPGYRLPPHVLSAAMKLREVSRQLTHDLGRDPETEEAARAADLPIPTASRALGAMRKATSLDRPSLDNSARTLGDLLAAPAPESSPLDDLQELRMRLEAALRKLPAKERDIIKLRYGLNPRGEVPRHEVAEQFGLTTERVRQIEIKTVKKMKDAHRYGRLDSFL